MNMTILTEVMIQLMERSSPDYLLVLQSCSLAVVPTVSRPNKEIMYIVNMNPRCVYGVYELPRLFHHTSLCPLRQFRVARSYVTTHLQMGKQD